MIERRKLAIILLVLYAVLLAAAAGGAAAFWADLDAVERSNVVAILAPRASLLALVVVGVFTALGFLVKLLFRDYVSTPLELAEATRILSGANPSLRLELKGSPELKQLGQAINAFADQHEALRRDVEARIEEAQRRLQEEKGRLAALIAELTQGVVVCTLDGRILLYNDRARDLLGGGAGAVGGAARPSLVGLGRSLFAVVERGLVAHALESLENGLRRGETSPRASLVFEAAGGHLVRLVVTPVRGAATEPAAAAAPSLTGFVLLADDVTREVETADLATAALDSLVDATRRSVGSIRAAVETMLAHLDGMDAPTRARFLEVVRQEAATLTAAVDAVAAVRGASPPSARLLEDARAIDLLGAASALVQREAGVAVAVEAAEPSPWVRADGFALVRVLAHLATRVAAAGGRELRLGVSEAGRLRAIDLAWRGTPIDADRLAAWETEPVGAAGAGRATPLQVLERHGGELWHEAGGEGGAGRFRLLVPPSEPVASDFRPRLAASGRPEFYDFDLFGRSGQSTALDDRPLADLAFTVFDTETTGLDPTGGDEIVSVGAMRIVNGRILHHEAFDQLVDPRRAMPAEASRITGIQGAMLRGQPPIEDVLAHFRAYCEDTVLVAHNAAFDMRFLQLKEAQAGVRFDQPVLDTMLLAAVVQPNLRSVSLEDLAALYGVNVIGRHTALGDALMTAEIFLKMLALLAGRGIVTLREARAASERTLLARIKY